MYVVFGFACLVAFVGVLGMQILVGVGVFGRRPANANEVVRWVFARGPLLRPQFRWLGIAWFLGCGLVAIGLVILAACMEQGFMS
jgi:hypothetical protein